MFNPFTPESDQCQNSPAASQEIWHHTVWRTWLFIAYSDEKWLYYKFSLHHSYNRFLKGWENTLFELRSERVNRYSELRSERAKEMLTFATNFWKWCKQILHKSEMTSFQQGIGLPISLSKTGKRSNTVMSLSPSKTWGKGLDMPLFPRPYTRKGLSLPSISPINKAKVLPIMPSITH